jgi:arsenite methyltransferase
MASALDPMTDPASGNSIHEAVRERYAQAALSVLQAPSPTAIASDDACCGSGCGCGTPDASGEPFGAALYEAADRAGLPDAALLASLGCGNPTAVADLREGETVLDLGSGGGIDVLLSARRVGPTGRAIGLDMTDEMLDLARRNARDAEVVNVEFLKGTIESVPLPPLSVDVVISNCVVNLAADKDAVFREIARVLRPGGRVGISDVVARDDLTPTQRAERGSYAGCIAGALTFDEYERGLRKVGFEGVTVRPTHEVADGMFAAIIRAQLPCGTGNDATKGGVLDGIPARL